MTTPRGRLWTAEDRRPSRNLERCWDIVRALVVLPCDSRLTAEQQESVVGILEEHGATRSDFTMLDERPGYFGYEQPVTLADGTHEMREWHWKLRQTRNTPGNRLFEVLL